MARDLQTVIIKKSHPDVKSRGDAETEARKYAKRIYTSRETDTSYRFRQRPPMDFVEGSMRTNRINDHVSLVYGELK